MMLDIITESVKMTSFATRYTIHSCTTKETYGLHILLSGIESNEIYVTIDDKKVNFKGWNGNYIHNVDIKRNYFYNWSTTNTIFFVTDRDILLSKLKNAKRITFLFVMEDKHVCEVLLL
jgi:hypothetical protein